MSALTVSRFSPELELEQFADMEPEALAIRPYVRWTDPMGNVRFEYGRVLWCRVSSEVSALHEALRAMERYGRCALFVGGCPVTYAH